MFVLREAHSPKDIAEAVLVLLDRLEELGIEERFVALESAAGDIAQGRDIGAPGDVVLAWLLGHMKSSLMGPRDPADRAMIDGALEAFRALIHPIVFGDRTLTVFYREQDDSFNIDAGDLVGTRHDPRPAMDDWRPTDRYVVTLHASILSGVSYRLVLKPRDFAASRVSRVGSAPMFEWEDGAWVDSEYARGHGPPDYGRF